jgi:glycosyltransferase involved in cell wall biosynthesis
MSVGIAHRDSWKNSGVKKPFRFEMNRLNPNFRLPIVYAYPCRWDMTPARQRHLMEAMSKHTRVFFLNEPVYRRRLHIPSPSVEHVSDTLTIIHNAMSIRFSRIGRRLGRAAAIADSMRLHAVLRRLGVAEYIYWLAIASPELTWGMNLDRLIYDCIDPCFDPAEQATIDRREFSMARRAKLVFCTAQSLLERLGAANSNSHLLPNACSASDYAPEALAKFDRPTPLKDRPGPIVGYMGTFDGRVDLQALEFAAQQLPDCTFALVGRVNGDQEQRVRPLRALANVVMPGSVSVEEGRAYVAAFDVGLVPFLPGPIGDGINPVKMWMYLLAGKPVVSTWIRECVHHAPMVRATRSPPEFVAAIRAALARESIADSAERTKFALRNTWADRAANAVAMMESIGLFQHAPFVASVAPAI